MEESNHNLKAIQEICLAQNDLDKEITNNLVKKVIKIKDLRK
jgi:hypothetical protein